MLGPVAIQRMDHVGVVVSDLDAATAFFAELGMELEGKTPVEGRWVDRVNRLENVRVDSVMMRTPDGHGRLELTKFHSPAAVSAEPRNAPPNTLGLRSVMFAVEDVEDVEDVLARLHAHGAELVGELEQYEDSYRLCYVRGPEGIIVALAEQLRCDAGVAAAPLPRDEYLRLALRGWPRNAAHAAGARSACFRPLHPN